MKKLSIIFAALACIFVVPFPALANDEICRMPGGFLDNGIGGTGLKDQSGDEDNGIGGTGAKYESAMISGTIYAFGSICVNGLRIAYDDTTIIEGDAAGEMLRIGQVVDIKAEATNGLRAKFIRPRYEIAGPITFVDPAGGYIHVMGERVTIEKNSDVKILTPGVRIAVSGTRNAQGKLVASLVTAQKDGSPDIMRGLLQKGRDGSLYINQTKVNFSRPDIAATALGSPVEATGTWNGTFLDADRLTRLTAVQKPLARDAYFSYEGYVEAIGPGTMVRVSGISMKAKDLLCSGEPLEIGERLVGMGVIDPSGQILIDGFVDTDAPATRLQP